MIRRFWFKPTRSQSLLVIAVCLLLTLLSKPIAQAQQLQPDFAALEAVVLDELKVTNTPGAAIGIVRGDRLIFAKGFGTANVETGALITPDTLFRLGSTTKMFTAAALVQLANAGKLKLNEPIGKYASGLSPKLAQVSSHHLLTHTAGLNDGAVMFGKHDDEALAETVRGLKDTDFFTEPGRIISYSNPGYWVAGYVTEQIGGKAYADQLHEALFKPLGMQRTTLRPTMAMTWPLAQGHEGAQPKVIRPAADNAGNWPAGSIFSSVSDLSRWVIVLLNEGRLDGQQVLAPGLLTQLAVPHAPVPGTLSHYGYGLMNVQERGVRLFQHNGSRSGYGSAIIMAPEQRTALIILANRTGGSLPKTTTKALELLLPLAAKSEPKPPAQPMTAAEIDRCIGTFSQGSQRVELLKRDGKLWLKQGAQTLPVSQASENRFTAGEPGKPPATSFALVLDLSGKAEFFHAGLRSMRRIN
jgi:CubicO group peptidase (beta-lactamase class C family)